MSAACPVNVDVQTIVNVTYTDPIKCCPVVEPATENTNSSSAEAGGKKRLRSIHGTYLRAHKDVKVDLVPAPAREWENWYIEDWNGTVVLKAIHSPGRFLRALPNGSVDLVPHHPQGKPDQMWKPVKNDDGSWSLMSTHGEWLSARQDGSVSTVAQCQAWEHFWLEVW